MNLDPLRQEIEAFLREVEEEKYQQRAGLKPDSQLGRIYERHERLWQPGRVEEMRAALATGGAPNGPRLLLQCLTHISLEAEVRDLFQEAGANAPGSERIQ